MKPTATCKLLPFWLSLVFVSLHAAFASSALTLALRTHSRTAPCLSKWPHRFTTCKLPNLNMPFIANYSCRKIGPLNHALYKGQPVIGYMNQRVTINTALLAQINHNNHSGAISPAEVHYVTATPMVATAHVEPIHAQASAPPTQSAEVYNKPV